MMSRVGTLRSYSTDDIRLKSQKKRTKTLQQNAATSSVLHRGRQQRIWLHGLGKALVRSIPSKTMQFVEATKADMQLASKQTHFGTLRA